MAKLKLAATQVSFAHVQLTIFRFLINIWKPISTCSMLSCIWPKSTFLIKAIIKLSFKPDSPENKLSIAKMDPRKEPLSLLLNAWSGKRNLKTHIKFYTSYNYPSMLRIVGKIYINCCWKFRLN